jgi:hypothetical protein
MPVVAVDPNRIGDACKEAFADALLNNLAGRVSGARHFGRAIYGSKPRDILVSGFLVGRQEQDEDRDEEVNPLRINAHGLDVRIAEGALEASVSVALRASVYVRVFPTADDFSAGRVIASPQLTTHYSSELWRLARERLTALQQELGLTGRDKNHPEWEPRQQAVRRQVHEELGIPYSADGVEAEPLTEGSEEPPPTQVRARPREFGPDDRYERSQVPQKWIRLDLDLQPFEFRPANIGADLITATRQLKEQIDRQLALWHGDSTPGTGGAASGYRTQSGFVPSDLNSWDSYVARRLASDLRPVLPELDLQWTGTISPDPLLTNCQLLHLVIENLTVEPERARAKEVEVGVFSVSFSVTLPKGVLRPVPLERVRPSYRYNAYLRYPAQGFNAGTKHIRTDAGDILTTTWTPRYTLPRSVPRSTAVDRRFATLATIAGIESLTNLVTEFEQWLAGARRTPIEDGLDPSTQATEIEHERGKLAIDVDAWESELTAIRHGVHMLQDSAKHWSGPGRQTDPRGIPCEAWCSLNLAMKSVGAGKYDSWRLFQVAFIVAMLPTFATRAAYQDWYDIPDIEKQATSVTLLYFATGGGKSEAFLGLLLLALFIDRLRGKHRGITALMRYPLRLLTLQQAKRTMKVLAAGEVQRTERKHGGEPFSLGFWVGSGNTPNWHNKETRKVHSLAAQPLAKERELEKIAPYSELKRRWRKLDECPFCGGSVALRMSARAEGDVLGHYCTAARSDCAWQKQWPSDKSLPFYIVDEDIYHKAPSVLLGTVDKLAVIGQSFRTIRHVLNMFGFAPFADPANGNLKTFTRREEWEREAGSLTKLFPAHADGLRYFVDPFPSLLIQDEAHLLEESLGTFAGLFESALEAALDELSGLDPLISRDPAGQRRKIKVIAASATVSEPERQMKNLYQRDTFQFPHPGPSLYSSFYSDPKEPEPTEANRPRTALSEIEQRAIGARIYSSLLTNGHKHTVAVSSVLAQFHLLISDLDRFLRDGTPQGEAQAKAMLSEWISDSALRGIHRAALSEATASDLLTLTSLHRIALTYVTNKKGGDQLIDTERAAFEDVHQSAGYSNLSLQTALVSGAVSASDIQNVVRQAERRPRAGETFPELSETLRSIIATSAISHGVDVEEFNSMFFAGLPSDIAEYIQASSRVGRTHVGFSLLIPVPQRRRDRFVAEIFDIFHRFLERMVLPAAVDRWAEKAVIRVIPSIMQEYLCGVTRIVETARAAPADKGFVRSLQNVDDVRAYLRTASNLEALRNFIIEALGLRARPPLEGAAYYEAKVRDEVHRYLAAMDGVGKSMELGNLFGFLRAELRPMMSLRDVDLPGVIAESPLDINRDRAREGHTNMAMSFIRHGSTGELDDDDDGLEEDEA